MDEEHIIAAILAAGTLAAQDPVSMKVGPERLAGYGVVIFRAYLKAFQEEGRSAEA